MPVSLEQFVEQLAASRLMSSAEVEALMAALPKRSRDAEHLARELVRHKKLTAFQAQQIYAGKGKSLLLGNYRILDKLGQGGMGMVLKAEHQRMKRLVAIKVLSPSVTKTPEALKRFQREVEAAAKLRHPNIVAADDADEAHGVHFLVMEFVEGSDLSAWVKKHGVMPLAKALACLVQAARGLEYAHARGVVHRDIKPANLLLCAPLAPGGREAGGEGEGTVKILDMGLARLDSAGAQQDELTGTGQIMGTVDYMAPEQAMNTKTADARADIYSLGVTLWYLLTARPMYVGETPVERLLAHQSKPIPSLRAACTAVTPAIEQVFLKMVAKAPGDRYQTMSEVIAELQRCQATDASVPALSAVAGEDTKLHDFLRGIETPARFAATTLAVPLATVTRPASAAQEATIDTGKTPSDTDPQTQQLLSSNQSSRSAEPQAGRSRKRSLLVATAIGGGLLTVVLLLIYRELGKIAGIRPESNPATLSPLRKGARAENAISHSTQSIPSTPRTPRTPPPAIAPFDAVQARGHQEAWAKHLEIPVEFSNSLGGKSRLIPPGEFTMGSTQEELAFWQKQETLAVSREGMVGELPPHRVRLTKPFYAGIHEVTVRQFRSFATATGFKPSGPGYKFMGGTTWTPSPDCTWDKPGWEPNAEEPVVCVSLADAQAFCRWLSQKEQRSWRLPTEAEWEFMARAGTTTAFSSGTELTPQMARIANAVPRPANVGSFAANAFGLFDMQGNAWERTADWFSRTTYQRGPVDDPQPAAKGTLSVDRGGGWFHSLVHARSAHRGHAPPDSRVADKGFRIVCDVPARSAIGL